MVGKALADGMAVNCCRPSLAAWQMERKEGTELGPNWIHASVMLCCVLLRLSRPLRSIRWNTLCVRCLQVCAAGGCGVLTGRVARAADRRGGGDGQRPGADGLPGHCGEIIAALSRVPCSDVLAHSDAVCLRRRCSRASRPQRWCPAVVGGTFTYLPSSQRRCASATIVLFPCFPNAPCPTFHRLAPLPFEAMCTVGRESITMPNPATPCARSLLYIGGSLSAAISCFMVMRFATWLLPGAQSMAFQVWRHNTCLPIPGPNHCLALVPPPS